MHKTVTPQKKTDLEFTPAGWWQWQKSVQFRLQLTWLAFLPNGSCSPQRDNPPAGIPAEYLDWIRFGEYESFYLVYLSFYFLFSVHLTPERDSEKKNTLCRIWLDTINTTHSLMTHGSTKNCIFLILGSNSSFSLVSLKGHGAEVWLTLTWGLTCGISTSREDQRKWL